uniref:Uncharacterized protein n=1 Tax=Oryza glumipatula TaxID=40148 RepID=A0A0E0A9W2_9ORYZ
MGSGRRRRSAILCRHRSTSKVAITVHPSPTHGRSSVSLQEHLVTAARAASGHLRRQDEHHRVRKSLAHFSPFGCDVGLAADVDVKPAGQ